MITPVSASDGVVYIPCSVGATGPSTGDPRCRRRLAFDCSLDLVDTAASATARWTQAGSWSSPVYVAFLSQPQQRSRVPHRYPGQGEWWLAGTGPGSPLSPVCAALGTHLHPYAHSRMPPGVPFGGYAVHVAPRVLLIRFLADGTDTLGHFYSAFLLGQGIKLRVRNGALWEGAHALSVHPLPVPGSG